jgi:diguanylate cyclase (GGDEF)-like protein
MTEILHVDQTALGVVLLIITLVNGWTMVFVRIWQRDYRGPLWWALTNFLLFASFLTAGLRGTDMPPPYAAFANATYVVGLICLAYGFYEFFEVRMPRRFYGAWFGLWLVVGNFFSFVVPDLAARVGIATLITIALSVDIVALIRRHAAPGLYLAYYATAAIFPLAVALMILRLIGALSVYGFSVGYTYAEVNTLTVVLAIVMTLGMTFGQVMMISARFQTDLRDFADRFKFEAMHDPLTGAGNRRMFVDHASRLLAIRQRHVRPFSLISLDLDFFKKVNDTQGHAVGDKVLQAISRTLRQNMRGEDVLARIGGEEFAILMPETTYDDALAAAERHRAAIESLAVPHRKVEIRVTCSFGVTEGHPDDADPDAIMARADGALFEAKQAGRNRVVGRPYFQVRSSMS